jgi:integrase
LTESFRKGTISSGELKSSTWVKIWQPRMREVIAVMQKHPAPSQSRQLLEAVTTRWSQQPGARGRQIQVQQTAALLRWGVDGERLSDCWAPPLDLSPYVGRKRAEITRTTPIEVQHILEMVDDIPDPRWQLAFQLMAAYGLRPEELRHLERRGDQLHCSYRKVASRGSTPPRNLRLLPCDEWAAKWDLLNHVLPERMPPLRAGESGDPLATYLKRGRRWQELRNSYTSMGEKLVPYSLRHAYAHRAHVVLWELRELLQIRAHRLATSIQRAVSWVKNSSVRCLQLLALMTQPAASHFSSVPLSSRNWGKDTQG